MYLKCKDFKDNLSIVKKAYKKKQKYKENVIKIKHGSSLVMMRVIHKLNIGLHHM